MTEYTVIYFGTGLYHSKKTKVKKKMSEYGFSWNGSKTKDLTATEIKEVYDYFKVKMPDLLVGRSGSSGVWENNEMEAAVKIVMVEKKDEKEHLPVILIFKGKEHKSTDFYRDFVSYCADIGCLISKVSEIDGQIEKIFEKRKNVEMMGKLGDENDIVHSLKDFFLAEMQEYKLHGVNYSDKFIEGWLNCTEKYKGYGETKVEEVEEVEEVKIPIMSKISNAPNVNVPKKKVRYYIKKK